MHTAGVEGRVNARHLKLGPEALPVLGRHLDRLREEQTHLAALVHDGSVAEGARHLGWDLILAGAMRRAVESQALHAFRERDAGFVEDGGPLEGCSLIGISSVCLYAATKDRGYRA